MAAAEAGAQTGEEPEALAELEPPITEEPKASTDAELRVGEEPVAAAEPDELPSAEELVEAEEVETPVVEEPAAVTEVADPIAEEPEAAVEAATEEEEDSAAEGPPEAQQIGLKLVGEQNEVLEKILKLARDLEADNVQLKKDITVAQTTWLELLEEREGVLESAVAMERSVVG